MKRFLCTVIATTIVLVVAQAQHATFGLKAGVNAASIKVDNGEDFEAKAGFHAGGLAHIHINRHFAIQPEVMYSMQGGEDGDDNYKVKLNYINVPVLAQYMFSDGFRVQAGPQIGFLTSAKVKVDDVEVDIDDDYKSVDISFVLGGGYLFKNGLGIDARYNIGITNIRDANDFEGRNRVFQAGLFYQFMRSKR